MPDIVKTKGYGTIAKQEKANESHKVTVIKGNDLRTGK